MKLTADVNACEPSICLFKTTANFSSFYFSFSSSFPVRQDVVYLFFSATWDVGWPVALQGCRIED